jgi:hypothetical protein
MFSSKTPSADFPTFIKNVITLPQLFITSLIYNFNQVWNLATLLCINTFACLKINQY